MDAGEIFGRLCSKRSPTITCSSSTTRTRERIFNLGYYTWVEQQGVRSTISKRRKDQAFWRGLATPFPPGTG